MIPPLTISELSQQIKSIVEGEFRFVYVEGEISNYKYHKSSGHIYLTLKDDKSQISANIWSSRVSELIFTPENGMKVIVKGRITIYNSKGTYQVDIFDMKPFGRGDLQTAFERLKQKLYEEGLFEQQHKKSIPEFPSRVGIITSESGAALQDFIKITRRRYPEVILFVLNASMQGTGSVQSICSALKLANNPRWDLDLIVVTRGGGSIEDLWSFNTEKVVREIFHSQLPVVTAIGHEVDFTISDFVADLRAPTPSSAAEMIFPDKNELMKKLGHIEFGMNECIRSKTHEIRSILNNISNNYYFKKPFDLLNDNKAILERMKNRLEVIIRKKLLSVRVGLDSNEKLVNSLSPDKTMKRGFTIIVKDGKIISRRIELNKEDFIGIKFYDGNRQAKITEEN